MTILSFVAIFAGLGLGSAGTHYANAIFLALGIIVGSGIWWLILSGGMAFFLHHRITRATMRRINWLSGIIMLVFGIYALKVLI